MAAPTDVRACLSSRLLALFSLLRACWDASSEANEARRDRPRDDLPWLSAVSYTHLTLPTICSV
eukprot:4769653-Alexandrium_andersonii.AAC.1